MYTLIYGDHNLDQSQKKVISIHESREESDRALSIVIQINYST